MAAEGGAHRRWLGHVIAEGTQPQRGIETGRRRGRRLVAPEAEAGLGQATGLGSDKAQMLLKILAPIVMAYLAKRMFGGGAAQGSPQDLGNILGQERQVQQQQGGLGGGLLGAVLDQDGDGQLGLGDLLKVGMGAMRGGG